MNKYLIFVVLGLGLFSCNTKENFHSPLYSFDINPADAKNATFTDLFENFEEIVIPTNVRIGNISKLILHNDTIILFDGLAQQIVVLNDLGKVFCIINNHGQGPGEYSRLADISYSIDKKRIYALDYNARKILTYQIDGKFIDDFNLNVTAFSIEADDQGDLLLYTSGATSLLDTKIKYNFIKVNGSGEILDLLIPYDKYLDNVLTKNPFTKVGGQIFIHYGAHDSIFDISQKEISPSFAIDVVGTVPFSRFYEKPNVEIESQQSVSKHGYINRVLISNTIINFNYVNKGFAYKYYYNRKTKRYKNVKSLDDDYYKSDTYFPIALNSKIFYFVIHPVDINNPLVLKKLHIDKNNLIDQNPLIIKCTLKEF